VGSQSEVETVQIHDLVPSPDEVVDKFLLSVGASVHFRDGTEL
jgi:hypothetical protein